MERRSNARGSRRLIAAMNGPGHQPWLGKAGFGPTRATSRPRPVPSFAVRPRIRAVTFDVGGTLIEVWPSVGHVYAEVAAQHGLRELSPVALNRRFIAAWRAATNFSHSRRGWSRLVDATFRGLTDQPPSRTFFPELYARFASADVWRIFADVLPTLDTLAARGLKLGVISNWDERLRPLLVQLKLARYFEPMVISREVHASKPSPTIFNRAARLLGLPPEAILHVGDDFSTDVCGARAAGMSALLLKRRAKALRVGEIRSLHALGRLPDAQDARQPARRVGTPARRWKSHVGARPFSHGDDKSA